MELNSKLLFGERLVRVFTSIFFVYSCIQHISMKLQHGVNQNAFFEHIYNWNRTTFRKYTWVYDKVDRWGGDKMKLKTFSISYKLQWAMFYKQQFNKHWLFLITNLETRYSACIYIFITYVFWCAAFFG